MSSRATEKTIEFYVFIILVLLFAVVETVVVIKAVSTPSAFSISASTLGALGLASLFKVFVSRMKRRDIETISTEDLRIENSLLKEEHQMLLKERDELLLGKRQVAEKIGTLITRLKTANTEIEAEQ